MVRRHYTPDFATECLKIHWDGWRQADLLIEPCVGGGDIIKHFPEKPGIKIINK